MKYTLRKTREVQQLEQNMQKLASDIQHATEFIKQIEEGNLEARYDGITQEAKDELAQALLSMRQQMKVIAEQERERNWTSEGLAHFINILRNEDATSATLYHNIISNLVKYVKANQGGLFIVNTDSEEAYLELIACYAFERKKYVQKRIELGEGLVGQAYLEKDSLYLTDIPDNYIRITSGLGTANPSCLFIVPLKINDQVMGVIELASFHNLEKYQRDFIEKLAENIAATIANAQMNSKMKQLLDTFQEQTTQLQAQEEEMRQNLEELQAAQEEIARQLKESEALKIEMRLRDEVFSLTTVMSEADAYGTIIYINDKFCEVSGYNRGELIGKPHNLVRHPDMPKALFKLMWQTIKSGKTFRGVIKNLSKSGAHYWVDANITPILDENGKPYKYIGARYVITDDTLAEALYQKMMQELNLNNNY
jgi:PAS domain S-box-containing protein